MLVIMPLIINKIELLGFDIAFVIFIILKFPRLAATFRWRYFTAFRCEKNIRWACHIWWCYYITIDSIADIYRARRAFCLFVDNARIRRACLPAPLRLRADAACMPLHIISTAAFYHAWLLLLICFSPYDFDDKVTHVFSVASLRLKHYIA